jgi:hypothetical protein
MMPYKSYGHYGEYESYMITYFFLIMFTKQYT